PRRTPAPWSNECVHPHGFDRHGTVPPGGPGSCPVSATGVGEQGGIPAAVRGTGGAVRRFGVSGSVGTGPPAPVAPRTPLSGPAAALCATPRHPTTSRPETFRPPAGRRVSRAGGPARAGPPGHGRRSEERRVGKEWRDRWAAQE